VQSGYEVKLRRALAKLAKLFHERIDAGEDLPQRADEGLDLLEARFQASKGSEQRRL
jgi:hypothetical protein